MPVQNRMMTLVAFLQAQNCSNLPGSWRHPSTMLDFLTPEYYQRIARTLEDGKIQMAFFDDRLALARSLYRPSCRGGRRRGARGQAGSCTILMTMGMATPRLGLGATYSTTYYEPFHVARVFATMDLMLKGRAAWNIVTSLNSAEAVNFGGDEHLEHDARYDRADEFMEVVLGPLEHLGRRRADPGQGEQPLRRSGQGASARSYRAGISGRADRSACRARRRGIRC